MRSAEGLRALKGDHAVLLSVTHARLRAQQGDSTGAAAILRELLAHRPEDWEAAELLASLPGTATPHQEPTHPLPQPATPASAAGLARAFRRRLATSRTARERLRRVLAAVTRHAR